MSNKTTMDSTNGSRWTGVPVLVTGGNGFIGSWLAKALVDRGADVYVLVRTRAPNGGLKLQRIEDRVTLIFGDLLDYSVLEAAIAENDIAFVFHLAAQAIVSRANLAPRSTLASNIQGTCNLLEAARVCSKIIRGVVVASSDKAYGNHEGRPYQEHDALLGGAPYEASKACTDLVSQSYAKTYGLPVAVARFCNIFGPGDLNFSRRVPQVLRRYVAERKLVYFKPSENFVREYMYAGDAADAYLTLASHLARNPDLQGEAFNFGTGFALKPRELLELIAEAVGAAAGAIEMEPTEVRRRDLEIPWQTLNSDKARRRLGWAPAWKMKDALRSTWAWYSEFLANRIADEPQG